VVELVLSRGAYLRAGDDWLLVADPDAPFGPLSVAVAGLRLSTLRPGQPALVEPSRLRLGRQAVGLERLRERRTVRLPSPGTAAGEAAAAAEAVAAALAMTGGPPEGLVPGLRALRRGQTREGVRRLAGLGDGLTPAGDDALAGYAAWRHATGAPAPLSALAAGRSSPLGHAYLRCAERGELPEAGAAVVAALLAGEVEAAASAGLLLRDWGASSGAGLFWGIEAGMSSPSSTHANICSRWHTQPTSARRPESCGLSGA
jgi:hypothetical protein